MPEAEHLAVGRSLGPHEVFAYELPKDAVDVRDVFVQQVGDAGRFERPADHGRDAKHGALIGRESVEPGGKQGVHRGRQRDTAEIADQRPCGSVAAEQPFVDHHREQLLDEQRVALGRRRDPLLRVVIERRMVDEVLDQPVDIGSCERSK